MIQIAAIVLLIFGVVLTIQRLLKNARARKTTGNLVSNLGTDPAQAEKLAKDLYYKYASWPCQTAKDLDDLVQHLKQQKEIGKFKLNLVQPLAHHRYLFVTTCTDNDFDLNIGGKMGNAKKVYNLNFLLSFDASKQELVVASENYYSATDKGLRTAFANLARQFF